jgi:hypothetical protein
MRQRSTRRIVFAATLAALGPLVVAGCGQLPSGAAGKTSPQLVATSPSPDPATQAYIGLVQQYWNEYKVAEMRSAGNPSTFIYSCSGSDVDPSTCEAIAASILPPLEGFLNGLEATSAPQQFAANDRILRTQLPIAISDLKGMLAAATAGNKLLMSHYFDAYTNDMIPSVINALDAIDPSVEHN